MFILVIVPTFGILYLLSSPRLVEVSPVLGTKDVSAIAPLRLTFSHHMQEDMVLERLRIQPEVQGSFTWEGKTLIFQPDTVWPNGQTVEVHLSPGSRTQAWPSLAIGEDALWSFTIRQPRLAYLFPAGGLTDLYLLDISEGASRQLTDSPLGIRDFSATANGDTLYFSQNQTATSSRIERVRGLDAWSSDPEGASLEAEIVLECQNALCTNPQVSPDGSYLAYERTEAPGSSSEVLSQVWLAPVRPDGSLEESTLAGDPSHQTLQPQWAADGALAFYDTQEAAYVFIDPEAGVQSLFSNAFGQPGAWMPDGGGFVAVEVLLADQGEAGVAGGQIPVAGSHLMYFSRSDNLVTDLTQGAKLEDVFPAISPDGTQLVFARRDLDIVRWTPGRQIWMMELDGGEARQLTNDAFFNHYEFAWDPVGRNVVYVRSDQSALASPPEIWMMDSANGQATKLVSGGFSPKWLP
jgi:Tol biopolymer transport system component